MKPFRKAVVGAVLVGGALTGGAVGAALVNGAATAQTSTPTTAPAQPGGAPGDPRPPFDPARGGHVGANGVKEVLLTGDTAEKVKAAASAAVPGGTIERVETDAEGSPYEAHMTKFDGSHVTVKVDSAFTVRGIEDGPGGPH